MAIDENELEDFVLSNAPEYVASMSQADEDLRDGNTLSIDDVFAPHDPR